MACLFCVMYKVSGRYIYALLYTFILYHILFLLICDAFMCVHCIVFYSSATEALKNNNNNNNRLSIITWCLERYGHFDDVILNWHQA